MKNPINIKVHKNIFVLASKKYKEISKETVFNVKFGYNKQIDGN
jgi:hypothetical protein